MNETLDNRPEAIAVIGIGCRFPGAADPAEFWRLLAAGQDAVGDIPADRFDASALYDPRSALPGRITSRKGGFLRDIDRFDAAFFAMSPREAERLDPQQRLLLELAWEAFEDAGLTTNALANTPTGVFVGMWLSDYEARLFADPARVDFHMTTGTGRYTASGRLSHVFGLRGPSLTVDTACSSSLVAVHLACQSLRSGETTLAVAAGVNVILQPHITIAYSQSRMMAPDGRCKFGDARADGYVRSEGAGLLVLKPLARALADGDPIRGVVLGSAVNNDGGSGDSLGTPGRAGQEDLLRRAYANAGLAPSDVDYVEAHGTGTAAGDPVELQALAAVLGEGRPTDRPLVVGSVKTNIGHTEGAAGMAGLIKTVLAFEHAAIPASLHLHTPTSSVAWDRLPVVIPTALGPWPRPSRLARAGVSSFGIAGTNAHVVLEAAPVRAAQAPTPAAAGARVLAISAASEPALAVLAGRYRDRLALDRSEPRLDLDDVCYTAAVRRTPLSHRLVVTGPDAATIAQRLDAFTRGEAAPGLRAGRRPEGAAPRVAFVFPGQGSQWLGMGRQLLRRERAFAEALERCDVALAPWLEGSIVQHLLADGESSRLGEIDVVQPALFAVQVALTALWRAWGVEPVAVVGHSMGEVAAAHVAGVLELDDAARVIACRSRLLRRVRGRGAMAMVELSLDEARQALVGRERAVSIAVSNSGRSTVLSGDVAALDEILATLEARGVFCRRVKVDVASHSPQVDELRADLLAALDGLRPGPATCQFHSTVTGTPLSGEKLDAEYWWRNLRQPVLFASVIGQLAARGQDVFIEVSPHPILVPPLDENVRGAGRAPTVVPSLRRDEDERASMLDSLGALHAAGVPVRWSAVTAGRLVAVPAYPWQRQRHWLSEPVCARGGGTVERAPASSSLYRVQWRPQPLGGGGGSVAGRIVLLGGTDGFAERLAARLTARGVSAVSAAIADVERQLADSGAGPCRAIVHLCALDPASAPHDGGPGEDWRSALAVVHALARTPDVAPRLWLVTRGAQRVTGADPVSVQAAPLWGLGAVLALEHPALRCTRVDLPPAPDAHDVDLLLAEILGEDTEDRVAFRAGGRHVARLIPEPPTVAGSAVQFPAETTYLITGGLGDLGLGVAAWMVARGARHLALMGRRPPREIAEARLAALGAAGAEVRVFNGDVASAADVERVLGEVERTMPRLAGLVHAAGILDDGVLVNLDERRFEAVLAPKVRGGWNLHRATLDRRLDHFILFSSIAGVLGSTAQGSYAAANAFLDSLAHHRRSLGLPATSIDWGPWTELGLAAARADRGERLATRGLPGLTPAEAFGALERVVLGGDAQMVVTGLEPEQWIASHPASARALLGDLVAPLQTAAENDGIVPRLRAAEPAQRRPMLTRYLSEQVGAVLRSDAADIDVQRPLRSLGLDSLMSLELRNRLEVGLKLRLSATLVFNHPTVSAMTEHLAEQLRLDLAAPSEPNGGGDDETLIRALDAIEGLSDAEVSRLLQESRARE